MSKKKKKQTQGPAELSWFYLKPFLKYLRPHRLRLLAAFLAMLSVGFFGSFSILLLKYPLDILFGGGRKKQAQAAVEKALEENRAVLAQAAAGAWESGAPPGQEALLAAVEQLSAALEARGASDEPDKAEKQAKTKLGEKLPFLKKIRERAEAQWAPVKAGFERRQAAFEAWMSARPLDALWLFAGILIGFTLFKSVAEYMANFFLAWTLYHTIIKIKEDIFAHIMRMDYAFFIRRTTGFLESRISGDVVKIKGIFDVLISDAVQQPIQLVFLIVVLFIISPQLTLISLGAVVVGFWPLVYFARQIRKVTKKSKRKEDELSSSTDESLRNFRVVKIFGAEDYEIRKFRRLNDRLFRLFMNRRVARFASSPIMEVVGSVGVGLVLIVGGILVLGARGKAPILEPAPFMVYLIALSRFYTPMKKLSRLNINWQEASVSAGRILEMFRIEREVAEAPDALAVPDVRQAIEFKNVCFTYGEKPVLRDINLRLEVGKVVAMVGRSGAGKSTLANMLPRLFDPTGGAIEIDGVDARRLKLRDLRALFGVVTQDTVLFNDSVEANIAYGVDEIDEERVVAAAKAAHAHEFIEEMEGGHGYKTIIGQGGQRLSGGQRQRLAIARALYRDPQVLIFDEATSSLDVESERHVQRAIDNLLRGRTALIIAHRLSTIRHADEIVVLHEGRIVERGTHAALMGLGGEYWKLYHLAAEQHGGAAGEGAAAAELAESASN